ncbi:NAD(P)H-dependent oxidoreductase [Pelistega sp. NLN82]|uniref:NAD(P)H-dependent oxidoreductase n=1 Tax=Pelistega ratti TaxID=2652177 RepID=A0A6L9Y7Z0_9BURK|nr:NAD(P)H-dependent oxidoreductase [Pelistega ratti]NEN76499.1 NAD(P)H-dependent oxidoreductase [Pelistega ratti]
MNRRHLIKAGAVLTASVLASRFIEARERTMIKTLVIVSHPYPERSTFTKALQQAAESVEGVTVRNLETLYGFDTRAIDDEKERQITREHDRVVFIFPTHWFNITPMMKAYMNDVWGNVGPGLWEGKEFLAVTQAAGGSSTYGKSGRIGVDLKDVFLPLKASALHCGMTYLEPLAFEAADRSKIPDYQQALIARLQQ